MGGRPSGEPQLIGRRTVCRPAQDMVVVPLFRCPTLRDVRTGELRELFAYLYWIRDRVLTAAEEAGPVALLTTRRGASRDLRGTLVHERDVESGWRARLSGIEEIDLDPRDSTTGHDIASATAVPGARGE